MSSGFGRIVQQLGYTKHMLSPNRVQVVIPGLPYTAFDAHEYPQAWSVLNTIDSAQTCALHRKSTDDTGSLLNLHTLLTEHLSFSVAIQICFTEHLYNKDVVKAPLYTDNRVSYLGKTSLVIDTDLRTDSAMLATLRHQQLYADKVTRRSLPLPDWLRDSFRLHGDPQDPLKFPTLERPEQNKITRVPLGHVPFSDTDVNSHLNFSHYLKYSIDGILQGSKGKRDALTPVLVKSVFAWYRRECNLGDWLEMDYWMEDRDPTTAFVDMLNDGASVFQCVIQLYDSQNINSRL